MPPGKALVEHQAAHGVGQPRLVRRRSSAWRCRRASRFLRKAAEQRFCNTSRYTLKTIAADPSQVTKHLINYLGAFSENAQEVLDKYGCARAD